MTTWIHDDDPGPTLRRPAAVLDDPDTCTLEQYRKWQAELFDEEPGHLPPQTIRLRGDIL